ncbi:MAG: AraC family transcriptional regulator [Monoglobales bacterium]
MQPLQEIYFSNLNAICTDGGFFAPPVGTDWANPLHRFSQSKFYFVTKGRCRITVDGTEYVATEGDWFFIPPGTLHEYSMLEWETFEKYWMHFQLYPNAELFSLLNLPYNVNAGGRKEVYRLFKSFSKICGGMDVTDKITVKSYLLSLISEYIFLAHPDGVPLKRFSDNRIDEILEYISENLDKPLTVSSLADAFHLHPNHFIRFFKNKTGQTPAKYIKIKRLEMARYLLEYTDLYVSEIMERIGETDQSQFSKQFKAFYSFSPREYKKFFRSGL